MPTNAINHTAGRVWQADFQKISGLKTDDAMYQADTSRHWFNTLLVDFFRVTIGGRHQLWPLWRKIYRFFLSQMALFLTILQLSSGENSRNIMEHHPSIFGNHQRDWGMRDQMLGPDENWIVRVVGWV